jgi:hypothetical protein
MDELIALILVCETIWERAASLDLGAQLPKDSLLNDILLSGPQIGFSFERLAGVLTDQKERERANKLFSQKKYRLDLNNNPEEIIIAEPEIEFKNIVREIKKEAKKSELSRIIKDLKLAEEDKNKEAINFLRIEFKKISEEINEA